jgi:CheY-like chemotaxis protein
VKPKIPCFYHPTMPVFVDDDPHFLNTMTTALKKHYISKAFSEPQKALQFLQQYQKPTFIEECLKTQDDEQPDHRFIDFNINAIHEQAYNPHRFETIAVVIVDHMMPLNGLVFCEHIKHPFLKKILLTGETDEKIAVNAFNKGLIHRYLRKDDPLLIPLLEKTIAELQQEYFAEQSEMIIGAMAVHSDVWGKSYFNDPGFADIFYPFYAQQKPTEFYLASLSGSFLFLNEQGVESQLTVVDEALMRTFEELIDEEANEDAAEMLTAIQSREKILISHQQTMKLDPAEWLPHLHSAKCVESDGRRYYYSYVPYPQISMLQAKAVVSYQQYLLEQG